MNGSQEFREKLEAEFKRVAAAKDAESDGEAMAKAASALGYTISAEDLERAAAEMEAVDDDELDGVAGGEVGQDEHGNDLWCVVTWHCYTAFRHTETENKAAACFKDYLCPFAYHHHID